MKKSYQKPPISFPNQLALLKTRGLTVEDETKALSYLQQISYFRLSAYFLPYQQVKDTFDSGVTFQQIIETYSFDRDLRLLVFDCIERIEIAIRTQFIYRMSIEHKDAHWQDKRCLFVVPYKVKHKEINPYAEFQNIISHAKDSKHPEVYIKHYMDNYNMPANPPAWMCFELLTMGQLSTFYRGLRDNKDKQRIADFFGLHRTVFTSWMHSLTYVRNICTHHSRLWNKELAIEPGLLQKPKHEWIDKPFQNNKRTFYFLSVLKYLLDRVNPGNSLSKKVDGLFTKYPNVPIQYLGIPSDGTNAWLDWKQQPLWNYLIS